MVLRRSTVTEAARIMLPTYAVMFLTIGLLFIFQNPERMSGPTFEAGLGLMSASCWGALFLTVGTLEALALTVIHRKKPFFIAMTLGAGLIAFWTVMVVRSCVTNPDASFTSVVWIAGWIASHIASVRSLAAKEHS